ncbi:hypothetical protein [Niallia nealsonii]|uniref:Uncharacterized protein n=1 Tax=Niallia nealsonii TaxID=115979 RepID=A0A2N0Z6E3_9BACI|nr:hypothetical protein [Niallia nealsonii]PKG25091.1 hypothetical protein CWS01_03055 [Niallia nealsonii]
MVTFAYMLIIGMLSVLTISLDMFVYHKGFMYCLKNIYSAEVGAGAITIVITAIFGFLWSVIVDIRLRKSKKQSKQTGN